ncbi:alkaline phosphatase D family protein [Catalinimonas niigatensis]|uniref:alkaline phosphatase D family protein n=1 Tax=Catalinimonas niigatensis TaxID=1397264 RepID=UPI002664F605|nr:alkaline phosphatase D family protein [Catalinimonas niigatensis]WPP51811.1 alkaline phosphatase D family protein [Catalinimonas niigatensis]
MDRREAVKAIAISTVTPKIFLQGQTAQQPVIDQDLAQKVAFQSSWQNWPDMEWVGPEYWGNRLQDWQIRDGKVVCDVSSSNRTLHCLSCQLTAQQSGFETNVEVELLNPQASAQHYTGFRLGAQGKFEDYRSAAVFGKGLDAGITTEGVLFIGEKQGTQKVDVSQPVDLRLLATPENGNYTLQLACLGSNDETLAELSTTNVSNDTLRGNIALVSHFTDQEENSAQPSVAFGNWEMSGAKISQQPQHTFGPICFAQYTLHDQTLKLTAQLAPVEAIPEHRIVLQIQQDNQWKTLQERAIDPMGRTAQFRIEDWKHEKAVPYRVLLELPLKNGIQTYSYEGTIAKEPTDAAQVKMAVFSCNGDFGFPDNEVSLHVNKHKPDLAVFLGDQFYESTGGFGIQTSPMEKASLDYLRKWYMFGWSYRDIFKDIPSACIPDDHDVYHGNVWGESGKHAPTDEGWTYVAQDQGGYKMPPEWVNMVQRTQTGHLPDPYDPTPVKQGIGVYYTDWNYGGISMAILEDRKFKSAPKNVLPEEAKVTNGFIQNPEFNIQTHYDIEADLLGERQLTFLKDWSTNWDKGTEMKAVLSQTNFCTVATLPKGSIIDSIVPRLPMPELGEYVAGDAPTTDMDSNGWPQKGRDEALRIIRKCFALHIAGDQHLASTVHYGVDEFGDAGYAFAGPALNNIFPRRWWPPVDASHQSLPGQPAYTGDFEDGFGNLMTIHAVANPRQTHREPAIIYDRATGYGIVTFNKEDRTMKIECWPRYVDPEKEPEGQYLGWPITVKQQDNYSRKAVAHLDELQIEGVKNPLLEVINEQSGETEYMLRIKGHSFQPHVFATGNYAVRVSHPESGREKLLEGLKAETGANRTRKVVI